MLKSYIHVIEIQIYNRMHFAITITKVVGGGRIKIKIKRAYTDFIGISSYGNRINDYKLYNI